MNVYINQTKNKVTSKWTVRSVFLRPKPIVLLYEICKNLRINGPYIVRPMKLDPTLR